MHDGIPPPPSQTRHPLNRHYPPDQAPPDQASPRPGTPPGPFTPWTRHPPQTRHPQPPPDQVPPQVQSMLGDMVNARGVRILLECNLVTVLIGKCIIAEKPISCINPNSNHVYQGTNIAHGMKKRIQLARQYIKQWIQLA